jgi:hypothetical protein
VTSSEEPRCSQARRAPFIHAELEAGATWHGFDAQRKTSGGGRPALMASQQVERARRSGRIWTSVSADASGSVLLVAGLARFRRRVRVQGNRPCASRLRVSGVRAEREQRIGDATRRGGPARGYAGVPAVFQQHTCVSRGSSAREQENPEVRGGVGIATQFGPIGFSHKSTTSNSSYSSSIAQARPQHLKKAREPSHRASSIPICRNIIAVAKANYRHHRSP